MSKLPYMMWYPSDFIVDTQTLSLREQGAWMRLINHIWLRSSDGTIRLTDREIMILFQDEVDNVFIRADQGSIEEPLTHALRILTSLIKSGVFEYEKKDNLHIITSRRIARDKHKLAKNADYQDKFRKSSKGLSKGLSKTEVRDKKSEVRSQKSDKDLKTTTVAEKPQSDRPLTDVQKVVTAFKVLQGFDLTDKGWDEMYFARFSKSAASLLKFLGNWKDAVDCTQDVYEKLTSKGLTVTLETVSKHAADWLKDKREREGRNGVLLVPSDGNMPIERG